MTRFEKTVCGVALGAGLVIPFLLDNYTIRVAAMALYYIILASSWNLLLGYAGQLSFAHAAFAGIGAYTSGLLAHHYGVHPGIGIFIGGAVAAGIGWCLGRACLRTRGPYLALMTLGFSETVRLILQIEHDYTRGSLGLQIPYLFGEGLPQHILGYFVMLALAVLTIFVLHRLVNSEKGLYFKAIREDEDVAAVMGVELVKWKVNAFVISSLFAGLAGAIYAHLFVQVLAPQNLLIIEMGLILAMTIVGGLGTLTGPIIGAILLVVMWEIMRGREPLRPHAALRDAGHRGDEVLPRGDLRADRGAAEGEGADIAGAAVHGGVGSMGSSGPPIAEASTSPATRIGASIRRFCLCGAKGRAGSRLRPSSPSANSARRVAVPDGSDRAEVPRPHRSDGGTGRDRRGQAFHLRQAGGTPVLLLGPAADDREVDVGEREPVARQVWVAGHLRFHDEPPRPPDLPRALAHRIDPVGVGRETLGIVVDLHDRVDLRRREEEPAKSLGARRRTLRRQQGRLGVAVVEGEEDRDRFGQRRSVANDEGGNLSVGIDRGVFLAPLLIVAEGELAKLVGGPDLGEHALDRA